MTADEAMRRIDVLLSHVWMVRTFLKHSPEAEEDEELRDVVRELYDYNLAVGAAWKENNSSEYLKLARKKYSKLRAAATDFAAMQPEISSHTNFQMAAVSLEAAVTEIGQLLDEVRQNAP